MQKHFTNTIFYQIELTAKYCKLLGTQVFEQYSAGITCEEYSVLDVLANSPKMCQRDLAKIILKDRANTGKLLDGLEKRGYVTRTLSIKNNRPVKIVEITDEGAKKAEEVLEKIKPNFRHVMEKINNSDVGRVSELLQELREILDETLEIQI